MTQTALVRLMLLAAGAGVSGSEFRDFIDAIYGSNPREILHVYNELRKKMRQIQVSEHEQIGLDFEIPGPTRTVRQDIIQLAKRADIRVSDAAERIRAMLLSTSNIDGSAIPEFSVREGFGRWVERVARAVGPSVLLNAAISALAPKNDPLQWRLSRP
jgi:hypothetical protein